VVPVARRDLLELLQADLLGHLEAMADSTSGSAARDAAAISKELRAVTAELESLAPAKESTVDDLAAKRAARRTEAAG
jgi:hypothetical protein